VTGGGGQARSERQPSSIAQPEQVAAAQPEEAQRHTDEQPQGLEQVEVDLTADSEEERERVGDLADPHVGSGDGAVAGGGTGDASSSAAASAPDCEEQVGQRATAPAACSRTRRRGTWVRVEIIMWVGSRSLSVGRGATGDAEGCLWLPKQGEMLPGLRGGACVECVKYIINILLRRGDGTHWCSLSTTTTAPSSLPLAPAPPSPYCWGLQATLVGQRGSG
jgi:hypothetical protein